MYVVHRSELGRVGLQHGRRTRYAGLVSALRSVDTRLTLLTTRSTLPPVSVDTVLAAAATDSSDVTSSASIYG